MDLGLKDRVALVAAASRGLGRAIAMGLAAEGVGVVICARGEKELVKTAQDIQTATGSPVLAVAADLTVAKDVDHLVTRTLERFGGIDILVTNAGGPPSGPFAKFTEDDWLKAVNLNFLSAVRLCRAVVPHMQERKWGRIITMTSMSVKQPLDNLILSNAVRLAVIGLTKSLANELAKDGILVNSVCPGWTRTARVEELMRNKSERERISLEEAFGSIEKDIPLGRMGQPEEVANLVVFLCSERASNITGTAIQVDGGYVKGIY